MDKEQFRALLVQWANEDVYVGQLTWEEGESLAERLEKWYNAKHPPAKWYNVTYYTLSDSKRSIDVKAINGDEAEAIARQRDDFNTLMSVTHLPYKLN